MWIHSFFQSKAKSGLNIHTVCRWLRINQNKVAQCPFESCWIADWLVSTVGVCNCVTSVELPSCSITSCVTTFAQVLHSLMYAGLAKSWLLSTASVNMFFMGLVWSPNVMSSREIASRSSSKDSPTTTWNTNARSFLSVHQTPNDDRWCVCHRVGFDLAQRKERTMHTMKNEQVNLLLNAPHILLNCTRIVHESQLWYTHYKHVSRWLDNAIAFGSCGVPQLIIQRIPG